MYEERLTAARAYSREFAIPFNRPSLAGTEYLYLQQCIDNGHISGDGPFTAWCQERLSALLGSASVMLTTSCTHALEMCALLLNIVPGDEVIVPSFSFVSTVNAFCLFGAKPVFVDIRPDTLNLDEEAVRATISPRTRAIVCVHYAGVGCEMDEVNRIAAPLSISVIEDNAHGLFGSYRGKPLGSFGRLATQSFHETKNISCGEGGALVINDAALIERAEIIREKGTNRKRYFRGLVDKYSWTDIGSSYLPSDLLAAYLFAQLEACDQTQRARTQVWNRYQAELSHWAVEHSVRLPFVPQHCDHPAHLFYLIMPDAGTRTRFISHMGANGIMTPFHYVPLHTSAMGVKYGGRVGDCPVAERTSDCLVRLPLYNSMIESEQSAVIQAILGFA